MGPGLWMTQLPLDLKLQYTLTVTQRKLNDTLTSNKFWGQSPKARKWVVAQFLEIYAPPSSGWHNPPSHCYEITRPIKISAAAAKSLQSCPTLCIPTDGSPPGSPVPPGKNTGVGCHFLLQCMKVKSESEVAQSCLTLSNPMDCSLPGSSVHGIFQARVLDWGAIAFSAIKTTHAVFHGCSCLLRWPMLFTWSVPLSKETHFLTITLTLTGFFLQWDIKNLSFIKSWNHRTQLEDHGFWSSSSSNLSYMLSLPGQCGQENTRPL